MVCSTFLNMAAMMCTCHIMMPIECVKSSNFRIKLRSRGVLIIGSGLSSNSAAKPKHLERFALGFAFGNLFGICSWLQDVTSSSFSGQSPKKRSSHTIDCCFHMT